jgi:hypothetical protein
LTDVPVRQSPDEKFHRRWDQRSKTLKNNGISFYESGMIIAFNPAKGGLSGTRKEE